MAKTLRSKGIEAAGKYLEHRGYEILEPDWKPGAEIVAKDDDAIVLCKVSVVEELSDIEPVGIEEAERLMVEYLTGCECENAPVRFDEIRIRVLNESRALLRHHINCIARR